MRLGSREANDRFYLSWYILIDSNFSSTIVLNLLDTFPTIVCPNDTTNNQHRNHLNLSEMECVFFKMVKESGINNSKKISELEKVQLPISKSFYADYNQCQPPFCKR